jgi:hypothetical protein
VTTSERKVTRRHTRCIERLYAASPHLFIQCVLRVMLGLLVTLVTSPARGHSSIEPPPADEGGRDVEDHPCESAPPAPRELSARNGYFLELGGAGLLYSLNYERRFNDAFSVSVGFGAIPVWGAVATIFPLSVHGWTGTEHHLEYGGGVTLVAQDLDDGRFWVPSMGYRYQRPEGGFLFRATAMGFFRMNDPIDAIPFAGLSAGWAR